MPHYVLHVKSHQAINKASFKTTAPEPHMIARSNHLPNHRPQALRGKQGQSSFLSFKCCLLFWPMYNFKRRLFSSFAASVHQLVTFCLNRKIVNCNSNSVLPYWKCKSIIQWQNCNCKMFNLHRSDTIPIQVSSFLFFFANEIPRQD